MAFTKLAYKIKWNTLQGRGDCAHQAAFGWLSNDRPKKEYHWDASFQACFHCMHWLLYQLLLWTVVECRLPKLSGWWVKKSRWRMLFLCRRLHISMIEANQDPSGHTCHTPFESWDVCYCWDFQLKLRLWFEHLTELQWWWRMLFARARLILISDDWNCNR